MKRYPCTNCGKPKGRGCGRRLCDTCRKLNQPSKICRNCKSAPRRPGKGTSLCETCYRNSAWGTRQLREQTLAAGPEKRLSGRCSMSGRHMAAALRAVARKELNPYANIDTGIMETVCQRAGIVERSITRWESGKEGITFKLADRILTRMGMCWWDVWKLPGPAMERTGHGTAGDVLAYVARIEAELDAYYRARWFFDGIPTP